MMEQQIDARNYIAAGTGFHAFIGWTLSVLLRPLFVIFTILVSYGVR